MLLWSAVALAAAVAAWGLVRLWRIAAVGSAYKSKVLCSITFGTSRSIDPRRAEEVSLDSYRLLRLFRVRVDSHARTVTTSLFGLRPRTARYRAGLGATLLLHDAEANTGSLEQRTAPAELRDDRISVRATFQRDGAAHPALRRVVDSAFAEPNPKRRRTRAIVVLKDGEIVAEQYARPFTADTPFAGWSMTKSVLNALVGILIGEGRLSLSDTAVWPTWQPPDARATITIEDLLRMRSGLKFSEVYADFSSDVIEMLFNQADTAGYAARQPLLAAPGTTWSYASGTTNILSAIVRRIVGDPGYHAWPRQALFDPIGMTSAILEPDAAGTFVCSSFMLATARDWARFGQLFLQRGVWDARRILPEDWVSFSTTPTRQSPSGRYGAHWWLKLQPEMGGDSVTAVSKIPSDAFFAVGHEGQTLTVIPSRGLIVVRLGLSIYIDAWNHAAFLAELLDAF